MSNEMRQWFRQMEERGAETSALLSKIGRALLVERYGSSLGTALCDYKESSPEEMSRNREELLKAIASALGSKSPEGGLVKGKEAILEVIEAALKATEGKIESVAWKVELLDFLTRPR